MFGRIFATSPLPRFPLQNGADSEYFLHHTSHEFVARKSTIILNMREKMHAYHRSLKNVIVGFLPISTDTKGYIEERQEGENQKAGLMLSWLAVVAQANGYRKQQEIMSQRESTIHSSDGFLLNVGAATLRAFHERQQRHDSGNRVNGRNEIIFADTRLELSKLSRLNKDSVPDSKDASQSHLKTIVEGSNGNDGFDIARVQHKGVICDRCGKHDFFGMRFKCACCDDFDLCAKCHEYEVARVSTNYEDLQTREFLFSLPEDGSESFFVGTMNNNTNPTISHDMNRHVFVAISHPLTYGSGRLAGRVRRFVPISPPCLAKDMAFEPGSSINDLCAAFQDSNDLERTLASGCCLKGERSGFRESSSFLREQLLRHPSAIHRGYLCVGCSRKGHRGIIRGNRYSCAFCNNYNLCERCFVLENARGPSGTHHAGHVFYVLPVPCDPDVQGSLELLKYPLYIRELTPPRCCLRVDSPSPFLGDLFHITAMLLHSGLIASIFKYERLFSALKSNFNMRMARIAAAFEGIYILKNIRHCYQIHQYRLATIFAHFTFNFLYSTFVRSCVCKWHPCILRIDRTSLAFRLAEKGQ